MPSKFSLVSWCSPRASDVSPEGPLPPHAGAGEGRLPTPIDVARSGLEVVSTHASSHARSWTSTLAVHRCESVLTLDQPGPEVSRSGSNCSLVNEKVETKMIKRTMGDRDRKIGLETWEPRHAIDVLLLLLLR